MDIRLDLLNFYCALQIIDSDAPEIIEAMPLIGTALFGVTGAVLGIWPAIYPALPDGTGWEYETRFARSAAELLPVVEPLMRRLEDELSLVLASHARIKRR